MAVTQLGRSVPSKATVVSGRNLRLHVGGGVTFGRPSVRPERWFSHRLSAWVSAPGAARRLEAGQVQSPASWKGGQKHVSMAWFPRRAHDAALHSHAIRSASSCVASSGVSGGSFRSGRGPWGTLFEPGSRSRRSQNLVARAHPLQLSSRYSSSATGQSSMFSPTTVYSRRSRISDGWRVRAGPNEEIPSGQHGSNSEDEAVRQLEAQIEQLHSKSAEDMEAATNNVRVALEQQSALRNALQEESSRSSSLESESAAAREETESLKNKLEGMAQHISQITHGSQLAHRDAAQAVNQAKQTAEGFQEPARSEAPSQPKKKAGRFAKVAEYNDAEDADPQPKKKTSRFAKVTEYEEPNDTEKDPRLHEVVPVGKLGAESGFEHIDTGAVSELRLNLEQLAAAHVSSSESDALAHAVQSAAVKAGRAEVEVAALQKQMAEEQKRSSLWVTRVSQLTAEAAMLRDDLLRVQATPMGVPTNSDELATVRSELAKMEAEKKSAVTAMHKAQAQMTSMQEQLNDQKKKGSVWMERVGELSSQTSSLQAELDSVRASAQAEAKSSQHRVDAAMAELAKMEAAKQSAVEAAKESKAEAKAARQQASERKDKINLWLNMASGLTTESASLKNNLKKSEAKAEAEAKKHQAQMDAAMEELAKVEAARESAARAVLQSQTEVKALKQEVAEQRKKTGLWVQRMSGKTAEAASFEADLEKVRQAARVEAKAGQEKLDAAMAELARVESSRQSAVHAVEQREAEVSGLKKEVADQRRKSNMWLQRVSDLTGESASLREDLRASKAAAQAEIKEIQEKLDAALAHLAQTEASKQSASQALARAVAEVNTTKLELAEQRKKSNLWLSRVSELTAETASSKEQAARAEKQAQRETKAIQEKLDAAMDEVVRMEAAKSGAFAAVEQIQATVKVLKQEVAEQKQNSARWLERVSSLTGESASLKASIHKSQAAAEVEAKASQAKLDEAMAELARMEAVKGGSVTAVEHSRAEVESLKKEVEEQRRKSSLWLSRVSELTAESASSKEQMAKARKQSQVKAKAFQDRLDAALSEVARMEAAKVSAFAAVEQNQATVKALKQEVAEQKQKSARWLERVSSLTVESISQGDSIHKSQAAAEAEAKASQAKLETAMAELARVEAAKGGSVTAVEHSRAEVESLKKQVEEQRRKSNLWLSRVSELTAETASSKEQAAKAQTLARVEVKAIQDKLDAALAEVARMEAAKTGAFAAAEQSQATVKALKQEVEEQKQKSARWLERVSSLTGESASQRDSIHKSQAVAEAEAKASQAKLEAAMAELARVEAAKGGSVTAVEQSRKEVASLKKQVEEQRRKSSLWLSRVSELTAETASSKEQAAKAQIEARVEVKAIQDKLDAALAEVARMEAAKTGAFAAVKQSQATVKVLKQEVAEQKQKSARWLERVSSLTGESTSQKDSIHKSQAAAEVEAKASQAKLEAAMAELARVEAAKGDVLTAVEQSRAEVASLKKQVEQQRQKSNLWLSRVSDLTGESASLKEELKKSEASAHARVKEIQDRLDAALAELARMEATRQGTFTAVDDSKAQVAALNKEVAEQRRKSNMWLERVSALTAESASTKEEIAEAQRQAQVEVKASQEELQAALAELAQMEASKQGAFSAAKKAQAEVAALRKEVAAQRQKSNLWLERVSSTTAESAMSKKQLAEAQMAAKVEATRNQERLDKALGELAQMERAKRSSAAAVEQSRAVVKVLERQVVEQRQKSNLWLGRVSEMTAESAATKAQLAQAQKNAELDMKASQAKLDAALAELARMEASKQSAFAAMEQTRAEVKSLKQQVAEQKQKSNLWLSRFSGITSESAALREDLRRTIARAEADAKASQGRLDAAMAELANMEAAKQSAAKAVEQSRAEVNAVRQQVEEQRKKSNLWLQRVSELTATSASSQKQQSVGQQQAKLEAQITQEKLDAALAKLAQMEAANKSSSKAAEQSRAEVAALKQEVASQRRKSGLWLERVSGLTAESAAVKEQLAHAQKQVQADNMASQKRVEAALVELTRMEAVKQSAVSAASQRQAMVDTLKKEVAEQKHKSNLWLSRVSAVTSEAASTKEELIKFQKKAELEMIVAQENLEAAAAELSRIEAAKRSACMAVEQCQSEVATLKRDVAAERQKSNLWLQRVSGLRADSESTKQQLSDAEKRAADEAKVSEERVAAAQAEVAMMEAAKQSASKALQQRQAEVEMLKREVAEQRRKSNLWVQRVSELSGGAAAPAQGPPPPSSDDLVTTQPPALGAPDLEELRSSLSAEERENSQMAKLLAMVQQQMLATDNEKRRREQAEAELAAALSRLASGPQPVVSTAPGVVREPVPVQPLPKRPDTSVGGTVEPEKEEVMLQEVDELSSALKQLYSFTENLSLDLKSGLARVNSKLKELEQDQPKNDSPTFGLSSVGPSPGKKDGDSTWQRFFSGKGAAVGVGRGGDGGDSSGGSGGGSGGGGGGGNEGSGSGKNGDDRNGGFQYVLLLAAVPDGIAHAAEDWCSVMENSADALLLARGKDACVEALAVDVPLTKLQLMNIQVADTEASHGKTIAGPNSAEMIAGQVALAVAAVAHVTRGSVQKARKQRRVSKPYRSLRDATAVAATQDASILSSPPMSPTERRCIIWQPTDRLLSHPVIEVDSDTEF